MVGQIVFGRPEGMGKWRRNDIDIYTHSSLKVRLCSPFSGEPTGDGRKSFGLLARRTWTYLVDGLEGSSWKSILETGSLEQTARGEGGGFPTHLRGWQAGTSPDTSARSKNSHMPHGGAGVREVCTSPSICKRWDGRQGCEEQSKTDCPRHEKELIKQTAPYIPGDSGGHGSDE
ncbi:hypothetical protein OOU_Y34scaffold00590g30 [Pyricularia oryzae Y34]|uniref:Uncharacterized protein n=2 Tax=Pyricularia oryzae TaxID=318829 RepID=A0AA97PJZ7_PYRO3|nr:hypothetical protein OOU_Y34scaffold00590g30 [Pyricularia oryzae Y34]